MTDSVEESVVLSTCNRVEVYGASPSTSEALEALTRYLIEHFGIEDHPIEFYRYESEAAAHHLFEVASGLDSMVLGETEIFGQVKKAYATAQQSGATGRRLNKLFQQSFTIGKLVRTHSKIQHGSTSVGSVAVDVAEKIFGKNLKGCGILIIGAGEMSRTTAQSLISRGASSIIVSNRSYDKAEELAKSLQGTAMRFDVWEAAPPEIDILISSTSAPGAVVKASTIRNHSRQRRGRPLYLIDIAVPRDIEEEVRHIEDVFLFNMDQLQKIAEEGRTRREEQIVHCRQLIADYLREKGIDALKDRDT